MEANNSEQAITLLKIANSQYKKLIKKVGVPIEGESHEKFELYHSYNVDECKFLKDHWDIPRYTNGSTRHAKCLFLVPYMGVSDACYAYQVSNNDEIEARFKQSELYDREKLLIKEYFGENLIEIIWSFDFSKPSTYGQHYYSIGGFWFGVKLNGVLINKSDNIKDLTIPATTQQCPYCGKHKDISKMVFNKSNWICTSPAGLYQKCDE